MTTLITDSGPHYSGSAISDGDDLWMTAYELDLTMGWKLGRDGMRLEHVSVPVPPDVLRDSRINVAGLWRRLGWPVEHVRRIDTWALCAGAEVHGNMLERGLAPDFELPDIDGCRHRLSDYRGRKVVLLTWAGWCESRDELPAWQALHEELAGHGATIIAVAMDSGGAPSVRPWLDQAGARFVSLLDVDHRIAAPLGLNHTPQAVWIDEQGAIVRPPETAGVSDADDPGTVRAVRSVYFDALRDWVTRGPDSASVASSAQLRAAVATVSDAHVHAHALFRLGRFLHAQNHWREAHDCFERALQLLPGSWLLWRQVQELQEPGSGSAAACRERRATLADGPFRAAIDLPGMP